MPTCWEVKPLVWGSQERILKTANLLLFPSLLLGGAITDVQNAAAWNIKAPVNACIIAPGEIATIMGSGFVPFGVEATFKEFPLPTTLYGLQVRFGTTAGALYYVSPGQINVQVPLTATGSETVITVYYNGAVVATKTCKTSAQAPGIFMYGKAPIITAPNGALVSMPGFAPVEVGPTGAYIVLYGSGFGPTSPAFFPGEPAPLTPLLLYKLLSTLVSAKLDGKEITVSYIGLTPGSVGLYQMNILIPGTTKAGNHKLELNIGGVDLPEISLETSTPFVVIKQ